MSGRKLTEDDVRRVLELRSQKLTQASIAKIFNVSTPNISFILTGRTWGHVTGIVFRPRRKKVEETPNSEPEPEPQPEPEPPPKDPNMQYCDKCSGVMSVKNTSKARYTVFVLWECNCGFEYLEKKTSSLRRNPGPGFFEERTE